MEIASLDCLCMGQDECILRISGSISSTNPRTDCDKFRLSMEAGLKGLGIAGSGRFYRLEEVARDAISPPVTEFAIEFTWRNQTDEPRN